MTHNVEREGVSTPALSKIIDTLAKLRDKKAELNKQIDKIDAEYNELLAKLREDMQAVGTDIARSKEFTAFITTSVKPQVTDWEAAYAFIHRNKAYYLLERRPSSKAYNELMEQRKGKPIPGIESFNHIAVTIRKR